MAERTILSELVQIGKESTYGTSVAATRKMAAVGFDLSPVVETMPIQPFGYKAPTGMLLVREHAEGDISGALTYNELPIIFNSLLKTVAASTTTGVSTWTWDWSPTTVENVDSYTIEQGDSATRAHKVTGGLVNSFNFGVTRTGEPTLGGSVLGQAFTDGITPTAALTAMTPIPIAPGHVDVYSDTAWAGVGTTKLLRVLSAEVAINEMWGPLWALNSTQGSFVEKIQQRPEITMTLTVEADSAGMAFLASNLRVNTGTALQIKATGPNIAGGTPTTAHSLKVDMWGSPENLEFGETDGVRTATWTFRGTVDGTSGKILRVILVNGVATSP